MIAWTSVGAVLLSTIAGLGTSAPGNLLGSEVCATADLNGASAACIQTADDIREAQATNAGSTYTIEMVCSHIKPGDCTNPLICEGTPPGIWYAVYKDGAGVGRVCLSAADATSLGAFDPAVVLREFRRLDWAKPELTIQPPNGKTLVNLETIFSTTLTAPQTQTLNLLGQRVTITATPAEYIWHPGTGLPTWRTTHPGAPWTSGADETQLNHFVYRDAGITVNPWLEIVYRGTYTVNGGPERTIPETRTITGPAQALQIVEARPVLTGN